MKHIISEEKLKILKSGTVLNKKSDILIARKYGQIDANFKESSL